MVHTQLKTGFYGTPLIGWKGALGRNVRCWNRPPQVGGEARGEAEAGDRVMCIFLFFMYSLLLWPRKSNKFEFVYIKKVFFFFIEIILRMVLLECFNSRLGWNEMPYFCNYYSVWGSSCKKNGPPPTFLFLSVFLANRSAFAVFSASCCGVLISEEMSLIKSFPLPAHSAQLPRPERS